MRAMAIGWLAVAALAGAGGVAAQPIDPAAGRALALELCSNCHLVPGATRPVPDGVPGFAAIARAWNDPKALADRLIAPPHPEMPPPPLGNRQRAEVAAWILSLRP